MVIIVIMVIVVILVTYLFEMKRQKKGYLFETNLDGFINDEKVMFYIKWSRLNEIFLRQA
jgi:hypothetical protein